MIDSNLLNAVAGTLGRTQQLNRENAMAAAQGPWAAMRLGGRYLVNQKRKDLDKLLENEEAFALESMKDELASSDMGLQRLADKRRQEFAESDFSLPDTVEEDIIADRSQGSWSNKELKELNPDIPDDVINYAMKHWGERGGKNWYWDPRTGKIAKKPTSGQTMTQADYDTLSGLTGYEYEAGDEEKPGRYVKRTTRAATPEETMAAWYEQTYGNETPEERDALAKAEFENAYKEALLKSFGGNEAKMEEFLALASDPRMLRYDTTTGRTRLKRADELNFDIGNYAKFWAPEMAQPYFDRSKDLLDLYGKQYGTMLSTLGSMSSDYEQKAEHMRQEAHFLQQQISQGKVKGTELASSVVDAQNLAAYPTYVDERGRTKEVSTVNDYIKAVQQAETDNRQRGYDAMNARERLLSLGPTGMMSAQSMRGNPALSIRFFGRNYVPMMDAGFGGRGAVQGAGSMPGGQYANLQDQAESARANLSAAASGGEYARRGLDFSNMNLSQGMMALMQAGATERTRFGQRQDYQGRKGQEKGQAYSMQFINPILVSATPQDWDTNVTRFVLAAAQNGNTISGSDRVGVGPLTVGEGNAAKFNWDTWNKYTPEEKMNVFMNAWQNSELFPSKPKETWKEIVKNAMLAGMTREKAMAYADNHVAD